MKYATIPMRTIGPIKINNEEVNVPLATLETPLWASVNRGAKVSRLSGGIKTTIVKDCMTRSILLEAPDAAYANMVIQQLQQQELAQVVQTTSNFAQLQDWNSQIIGNLLYIRFSLSTADAAGHNMTTLAAEALLNLLLKKHPELKYVSVSGNYCTDKKVSAVNGILGRGKYVVAELVITHDVCVKTLKTTPAQIIDLNIKKNLIGTIIAGGVRSANAHFANMLLAFYLATGQDAANIVEGSQGIVHTQMQEKDLYFSVTVPNIIVGTVGSGKKLDFVESNLAMLGQNARGLAIVAAAVVLCGELSLLAALTNPGELMRSHIKLERE